MRDHGSTINRAIQRFPLKAYLLKHQAQPDRAEIEWTLRCPMCGKYKLIVNTQKRAWHCWICENGPSQGRGGLLSLIQLLDYVSKDNAVEKILQGFHDGVEISQLSLDSIMAFWDAFERPSTPINLPAFCRQGSVDPDGIMPYCQRRAISSQDVADFGLYWCFDGQYAGRLIFPVWENEQLVYWQARAMWEKGEHQGPGKYVKSLNPPKVPGAAVSSEVLFNLHRAAEFPRVCITEGPIDAIHSGLDSVCTFGKRLSAIQIGKLLRAGVQAIDLMWDGPGPTEMLGAWPEMWRMAEMLVGLFDVRLVFLPQGDPGEYTREQLQWFREHSARRPADAHNLMEI